MTPVAEAPETIAAVTADQPGARLALAAAAASPAHAYLFAGPPGSGKRAAARALGAELLADGAPDPGDARRRALADPSPHPDLVWLRPPGTQHLVEEVRERVIAAAAYRPFEGERRVFVIEAAEAMAEESQNALLKTLEEPAAFAHLLLVTSEPEELLETVRSRCVPVRFDRLAPEAVETALADAGGDAGERRAAARLSGGDLDRARFLLTGEGRALREAAERTVVAARAGELAGAPWSGLLAAAEAAGELAAERVRERARAAEEEAAETSPPAVRRRAREAEEEARRASRRARTDTLDLGLALVTAWLRDLAAAADGAPELALNLDRADELALLADGLDARRARRGAELAMDTRRRLTVNVGEQLAFEALAYRLEFLLRR
jgi:DNA polymerase III subunit delta'